MVDSGGGEKERMEEVHPVEAKGRVDVKGLDL